MKYLKMPGSVIIAVGALMAFASPASATVLTSPAGTLLPTGTTIHAASEGHTVLDSPIGKIECNLTSEGKTSNSGGAGITIQISISSHIWTGCTNPTVHTLTLGTLEIHATGGGNGTVTSTGTEWTVETFSFHCIYGTTNTHIGTLTGGNPATLDIVATIPRTAGRSGAFCGSSAPWTGSYTITTPKPLFVS